MSRAGRTVRCGRELSCVVVGASYERDTTRSRCGATGDVNNWAERGRIRKLNRYLVRCAAPKLHHLSRCGKPSPPSRDLRISSTAALSCSLRPFSLRRAVVTPIGAAALTPDLILEHVRARRSVMSSQPLLQTAPGMQFPRLSSALTMRVCDPALTLLGVTVASCC